MNRSRCAEQAPPRFCPAGTTGSGTLGLLRNPESFFYTPASGFASLILRSTVRPLQGRNIGSYLPRDSLALIPRLSILRLLQSRGGVASMAGACTLIICAGSIALGPLRWGYWEYRTGFCCVLASRRVCPVSRVCRVRCVRRVRPVRPVRPVRRVRRVCPVPGSLALTSFRRLCRLLKSPYLTPGS